MIKLSNDSTLPMGWRWVKCQDAIDVRDGTHDTPRSVSKGIPLITSKNLTLHGIDFNDVSMISREDHLKIQKRSRVDRGDILFAMIGTIGNPVIVDTDREFSIKNVALFKFANSGVCPEYFKYLLGSRIIENQLASRSRGGNQKFVSLQVLRTLLILLPPLPEQRRIATILEKADVVRRKRREAIQLTEEFLRSAFLEMFGDPVTNPKRWEMASETIADFVDIVMGQSPPGGTVSEAIGIPLLNGPTEFGPHHPTPVQFTTDARKIANPGDLLFCVRGSTTGRMNWADQKYAIGRGIAAFRHRWATELQPFVRAVIEFQLPQLLAQATGSTFPNVSASQLAAIPYPNFSMLEQRRIAAILEKADVVWRKQREAIQQHNDLFNALVQRAFRGEL